MEFYYQDQLRWTLGFDNPNKAAALIASLLPLIWIVTSGASRLQKPFPKWVGVFFGSAILCSGWWLLFKTCSRGGIVAATTAFAYIGFCRRDALKRNWRPIVACAAVVAGLFISTRAAERSVGWIGTHEGSVENRLTLWRGGLEMLAANPQGVGRGKSGELYMQWFQPPDSTARYRTLVNSYLTFAAEQGIWIFGTALFFAAAVWNIGGGGEGAGFSRNAAIGLRASLLAFAATGFFSTTMEEAALWAAPFFCVGMLLAMSLVKHRLKNLAARLEWALATALAGGGILCGTGILLARSEPLRIVLSRRGDESATVEPVRRDGRIKPRRMRVLVDGEVMGRDYGKLVRRLALATGLRIGVSDSGDEMRAGEIILAAGEGVNGLQNLSGKDLVLLAPAKIGEAEAAKILLAANSAKLLLPGFDEDGRVAFWQETAENVQRPAAIRTVVLDGVGTQIEWAWDAVIRQCDEFFGTQ